MVALDQLAQSFGRTQPSSLLDELLEVAREVEAGLPAFYWSGPYRLQQRRLSRAARTLQEELADWGAEPAEPAHRALQLLLRLRRLLKAAHRALLACDWALMRRQLSRFQTRLGKLNQLTDQLEEAAGLDLQS